MQTFQLLSWLVLACQFSATHARLCNCTECLCVSQCTLRNSSGQPIQASSQPRYPPVPGSFDQQCFNDTTCNGLLQKGAHVPWCFNVTIQGGRRFKPLQSVGSDHRTAAGKTKVEELFGKYVFYTDELFPRPYLTALAGLDPPNINSGPDPNGQWPNGSWYQAAQEASNLTNHSSISYITSDVLVGALLPLPGRFNRVDSFRQLYREAMLTTYLCSSPECNKFNQTDSPTSVLLILPSYGVKLAEGITVTGVCANPRKSVDPAWQVVFTNSENIAQNKSAALPIEYLTDFWLASPVDLAYFDLRKNWLWAGGSCLMLASLTTLSIDVYLRVTRRPPLWNSAETVRNCLRLSISVFLIWLNDNAEQCVVLEWPGLLFHFMMSLIIGYFLSRVMCLLCDLTWPFQNAKTTAPNAWFSLLFFVSSALQFVTRELWTKHRNDVNSLPDGLSWLVAATCEYSGSTTSCCTNLGRYSWQAGVQDMLLIMGVIAAFVSLTKYYAHSIACAYASWTTLLLTIWIEYSRGEGSVKYEYGGNSVGLCWVSNLQNGWNRPMWVGFFGPTFLGIAFTMITLVICRIVVRQVQTQAFTAAKLHYLNHITVTMVGESFVLAVLLLAFYLAQFEELGKELVSGVLVAMNLIIWALLNLYIDVVKLFRHGNGAIGRSGIGLNTELRNNLFGKLLEQIDGEYSDVQPDNSEATCPTRAEMKQFAQLRRYWGMEVDYRETFQTLHDLSQSNRIENGQGYKELYTETVDHGGASGSFMFFLTNSDKYIVKTITPSEARFFLQTILPHYHRRMLHDRYKRKRCPCCKFEFDSSIKFDHSHDDSPSSPTPSCTASKALPKHVLSEPLLESETGEYSQNPNANWVRCGQAECGHEYCLYHANAHSKYETCEQYEARDTMLEQMPDGGSSLLVKVLGIYKAQLHPVQANVFYMVMEKLGKGLKPVMQFDLKGSNNAAKKGVKTMRDQDLRERLKEETISFKLKQPALFLDKLVADCSMLEEVGLMDYSLLLFVLQPEQHSLAKLGALLENYAVEIQTLEALMNENFGKTRAVTNACNHLKKTMKHVKERQRLLAVDVRKKLVVDTDEPVGVVIQTPTENNASAMIKECRKNVRTLLMHNLEKGETEQQAEKKCNGACVKCLIRIAGQMKLHRAQHILSAHKASLESLFEASERMLFGQSDCVGMSRDSLLADSVVGKCNHDGVEYELACCIIDLASEWGLPQRANEIGKMVTKTGGATGWMRCHDWGISAKPPDVYALRFLRSMSDYFGVDAIGREMRSTIAHLYDPMIELSASGDVLDDSSSKSFSNPRAIVRGSNSRASRLSLATMNEVKEQAAFLRSNVSWGHSWGHAGIPESVLEFSHSQESLKLRSTQPSCSLSEESLRLRSTRTSDCNDSELDDSGNSLMSSDWCDDSDEVVKLTRQSTEGAGPEGESRDRRSNEAWARQYLS